MKWLHYLKDKRKLTDEIIETFKLAYCDSLGNIYAHTNFPSTALRLDEKFIDAVLYPIFDLYDTLIGISAKPLSNTKNRPDYVNTQYKKGQHLYGLSTTWKECLKERKVYVVEGNVDVLTMWKFGIKNVVGLLSSNFSFTQLCILNRFVDTITFIPDGDNAGSKFISNFKKAISKKYSDFDINFKVINLPSGSDPDEFLKDHSAEELIGLEKDLVITLEDKLKSI